jgi:Rrf2 family protein
MMRIIFVLKIKFLSHHAHPPPHLPYILILFRPREHGCRKALVPKRNGRCSSRGEYLASKGGCGWQFWGVPLTRGPSRNIYCYMRRNSRLSVALHAMLHMAERAEPMTSEALAECLSTKAVVVRRTMAGLREACMVHSEKGHGGGWTLARDFATLTLHEVYTALGEPALIGLSTERESPGCLIEEAVHASLDDAFRDAEARLRSRLSEITMASLFANVRGRHGAHRSHKKGRPQ